MDAEDIDSKVSSMPDPDLVSMVRAEGDYRPEIVAAAREELRRRGQHDSPPPLTVTPVAASHMPVVICGVRIPFGDLVSLLVKLSFAAIPAAIIVWLLVFVLLTITNYLLAIIGIELL